MRFSMLYSGEQILSFKSCLVFYAGDSLRAYDDLTKTKGPNNMLKLNDQLFNTAI